MKTCYYGRISTTDGQTSASQHDDAAQHGVSAKHVHIDEGVSGYHVAPEDRPEWNRILDKLSDGGVLYVRWLDRISRHYDVLHKTMRQLMDMGVKVVCTMNGMVFDGTATDAISKATRDAVLAFMAAQGEADYLNRREMQRRGIETAKAQGKHLGRSKVADAAEVIAWRAEHGKSIAETAEHFGISVATVKRYKASAA
ncbi:recombinase family protein [Caballeronia novacaledonica]|uniref:Recombinase family protein n=1 Tax=Caballeronia novacaledonica TaxID=1544861 RepID=A0AA37ICL2_9BURK|nr:recombinase family protein [Caballeronia novacaledonica]GJH23810.1 recombinase family protein [Caballeronia novacaledonica]